MAQVTRSDDYIQCWHSSDHKFDHPLPAAASLNRTGDPARHANGALGTWVTIDANTESAAKYGKYLYQCEVYAPASRRHTIGVKELWYLSNTLGLTVLQAEAKFRKQRNEWLDAGYHIVLIQEFDRSNKLIVTQGIIVDHTAIRNWRLAMQ